MIGNKYNIFWLGFILSDKIISLREKYKNILYFMYLIVCYVKFELWLNILFELFEKYFSIFFFIKVKVLFFLLGREGFFVK